MVLGSLNLVILYMKCPPLYDDFVSSPKAGLNHCDNGHRVGFKEVKVTGMFKIVGDGSKLDKGIGSVSNFGVDFGNNKLKFVPTTLNNEGRVISELDLILEKELDEVIVNQGYYYCNFKSYEGMQSVIEQGPWLVNNVPLFVRKWEPGLCMSKPDTSKVSIWFKIFDIPLEAWNVQGISIIASSTGVPIVMDKVTMSICEKPYGRASFAKVLVEVDATKGLPDSVDVWYRSLGKYMFLDVKYIWKPPLCEFCKTFGHFTKGCSKKAKEDTVKNASSGGNDNSGVGVGSGYANSDSEGWQNVGNKRENRGNIGSVDEVLVTNEVDEEVIKGKDGVNEGGIAILKRFDILEEENDDMDVTDWKDFLIQVDMACVKGIPISDEVFSECSEEKVKFYRDEWKKRVKRRVTPKESLKDKMESLHSRIILVNKNHFNNAKSNATRMVKESEAKIGKKIRGLYNQFYAQALEAEILLAKDLQWERSKAEVKLFSKKMLTKDLINGHFEDKDDERSNDQVEVEEVNTGSAEFMVHDEASNVFDSSMAELQGETQVSKKFVNRVGEYVFGNWSWVSNSIDSRKRCRIMVGWDSNVIVADLISQSDLVMHFALNFVHDHRKQFFSFVYAHNLERDRKLLWENLKDHNGVVNGGSWVILGDFNAMLNSEDCSNSFSVRDKDMDDFRRCLEAFDLEDIASSDHCPIVLVYPETKVHKPRSFRFMNFLADKENFLPSVRDNWSIEVEGFKMFVLAKRLKNLKKYMRSLNRVNGNVFNKVKVLRAKLKKVQQSLDNDPNSVHLREEELVYNNAYREAVVDEEKVYKKKNKVEWIKEGYQNTAYFHKVLKGRVNKCRIEMVYDDEENKFEGDDVPIRFVTHFQKFLGNKDVVFPIEDVEGLFIKKLDPLYAEFMVRLVVDSEIREAMLSIKDDKAAGRIGKLFGEFNANLTSLIPKIQMPLRASDYMPISCCNVIYKCISKVVTNRMKEGLGNIIDSNQSAFISGRQISDNILLMQEFMRDYDLEKGTSRCAFKIDIQKACKLGFLKDLSRSFWISCFYDSLDYA
nr:hypothetical protein [Tanacetum cinerariifolium]